MYFFSFNYIYHVGFDLPTVLGLCRLSPQPDSCACQSVATHAIPFLSQVLCVQTESNQLTAHARSTVVLAT